MELPSLCVPSSRRQAVGPISWTFLKRPVRCWASACLLSPTSAQHLQWEGRDESWEAKGPHSGGRRGKERADGGGT